MRKLVIIGAGGHGRCCLDIARDMNVFDDIVFLDNQNIGTYVNDTLIVGSIDDLSSFYGVDVEVFVAIGNNEIRKNILKHANELGFAISKLVSPKAVVSEYASVGFGTVIFPNSVIEANSVVGNGCIINANTTVNHDAIINDYVLVCTNSVVRPNVIVEDMCRIGSGCVIKFGMQLSAGTNIEDLREV